MDISRKSCRLCLSEEDFNVSLFSPYCRKTNMLDKILVSLRLPIEQNEFLDTICYRCADNVERFYDFITFIKKAQAKLAQSGELRPKPKEDIASLHLNQRVRTSFVREQVIDADYTFSFLEMDNKQEKKSSSPLFSYFSPPNTNSLKIPNNESIWRTPKQAVDKNDRVGVDSPRKERKLRPSLKPKHHSRDIFESQSQEEFECKTFDWKLTPDENIIKKVRRSFFGHSDF